MNPDINDVIASILKPAGDLMAQEPVDIFSKDSHNIDLGKLVKDHIYELLTQKSLSAGQIALLSALMQSVTINLEEK